MSCMVLILLTVAVHLGAVLCKVPKWDHLVFAQQWPKSICIDMDTTHEHKCVIAKNITTWTVHGIWPTDKNTKGPDSCEGPSYNDSLVEVLMPRLKKYWPNLYVDTPEDDFWKHEWVKHGTCAASLPSLDSEKKYFQMGLDLNRKFDFVSKLKSHGITPRDNPYPFVVVQKAFDDSFKVNVSMQCVYVKARKTQYIAQVEMCLNKNFQIIKCPDSQKYNHNLMFKPRQEKSGLGETLDYCRDTEDIAYPIIHP